MTVGSKVKQTLATLKGIKSTLEIYAVQSQNNEAVLAYEEGLNIVDEIIIDLEERVQALEFEEPQYKGL